MAMHAESDNSVQGASIASSHGGPRQNVTIRLTPEEVAYLRRMAGTKPLSAYIRDAAMDKAGTDELVSRMREEV